MLKFTDFTFILFYFLLLPKFEKIKSVKLKIKFLLLQSSYLTNTSLEMSFRRKTFVPSFGWGGFFRDSEMKKDMVKLLSHAGPWPGWISTNTGAVMAIFSPVIIDRYMYHYKAVLLKVVGPVRQLDVFYECPTKNVKVSDQLSERKLKKYPFRGWKEANNKWP